jgi:hypothetical protein
MLNESTNILMIGHLLIFVVFVENGFPMIGFLGLLEIIDCRKYFPKKKFMSLVQHKIMGLDLDKCIAFGSNELEQWLGKRTRVAQPS